MGKSKFAVCCWLVVLIGCYCRPLLAKNGVASQTHEAKRLFDKGVAEAKQGRLAGAEELLRQAIKLCPVFPGAYIELGNICVAQKNYPGGLDYYLTARECFYTIHYDRLKDLTVRQLVHLENAADALTNPFLQYKRQAGLNSMEDIVQMRDTDRHDVLPEEVEVEIPPLLNMLIGATRIQLMQFAKAEQDLLAGVKKSPKNGEMHFHLGVAQFWLQKYTLAAEEARLAKKHGFRLPDQFVQLLESRGQLKI